MKKYLIAATTVLAMAGLSRADDGIANTGKGLVVINGGKVANMTAPATLPNGTKVFPDGTVISKDGKKGTLPVGMEITYPSCAMKSYSPPPAPPKPNPNPPKPPQPTAPPQKPGDGMKPGNGMNPPSGMNQGK